MTLDFGELWNLSMSAVKLKEPEDSIPRKVKVEARELISLTLTGFQGATLVPQISSNLFSLARKISSWHCPNLKELNLTRDDYDTTHNARLLFASANGLEHLAITDSMIQSTTTIQLLLQRHANTLQSIDMSRTLGLTSSDLQLILTSCPNLIDFTGPGDRLLSTDLIKQPWVCRRLQSLVVFLQFPPMDTTSDSYGDGNGDGNDSDNGDDDGGVDDSVHTSINQMKYTKEQIELYQPIYDQLAPLTQLKSIRFGGFCRGERIVTGIPWNLKAGLDKLRGLSKIETIYLTGDLSEIGMEEAKWFKKYWPRLKSIRRMDSRIKVLDTRISDILGPGVEV
ncbi:hypothetical protein BGX26_003394, partial [Mortierella sp. AD094]